MNKNPAHTDCLLDHIVKPLIPSCKSKGETQSIFSKISVVLDAQPETQSGLTSERGRAQQSLQIAKMF